jgi:hypothetical protein
MSPTKAEDVALHRVSWEKFFRVFDDRELEFLYQEHTQDGSRSHFNKCLGRGSDPENR